MDQQQAKCPPQRCTQHFLRLCGLLTSGLLPPAAAALTCPPSAQSSPTPAGGSLGRQTAHSCAHGASPSTTFLPVHIFQLPFSSPSCLFLTKNLNSDIWLPLLSAQTPNLYPLIMYHSCPIPNTWLVVSLTKSKIIQEVAHEPICGGLCSLRWKDMPTCKRRPTTS